MGRPDIDAASWETELGRIPQLSERELQVFLLLGAGLSNRRISGRISVTERTVKAHVAQILSKLQVESRLQAGLVSYAYQTLRIRVLDPAREMPEGR